MTLKTHAFLEVELVDGPLQGDHLLVDRLGPDTVLVCRIPPAKHAYVIDRTDRVAYFCEHWPASDAEVEAFLKLKKSDQAHDALKKKLERIRTHPKVHACTPASSIQIPLDRSSPIRCEKD